MNGWNTLNEETGIFWREYAFRDGAYATTLVFRGHGDELVVVSPSIRITTSEMDALQAVGKVTALVANNNFHHMGQALWAAHFPEAVSYAPPQAIPRLQQKSPHIHFRPLSELSLPNHVSWEDPPGMKTGEALFCIRTEGGSVWYTGDLLTNIQKMPKIPFRWLFSLTNSAPGFRLFRPAIWVFVKDKAALRNWALRRFSEDPPCVVITAHGPPVTDMNVSVLAQQQLSRI